MAAKKETYSQAMERLEKIVRQIDNNELDIDTLSEKIKEANRFMNEANYIEIKIRIEKLKREIEEILKQARMEKNKYNQNHQKLEGFVSIEQSIDEGIHKR